MDRELGGRRQVRLGKAVDAFEGPGLVALDAPGRPVGLVTWLVGGSDSAADEAEVRVLVVEAEARGSGAGAALLDAAETELRHAGVGQAWLLTTNDNVEAMAFYQRRGWRLAALHPGAVDLARATLKPSISRIAPNGIAIRDELVLAKDL